MVKYSIILLCILPHLPLPIKIYVIKENLPIFEGYSIVIFTFSIVFYWLSADISLFFLFSL